VFVGILALIALAVVVVGILWLIKFIVRNAEGEPGSADVPTPPSLRGEGK